MGAVCFRVGLGPACFLLAPSGIIGLGPVYCLLVSSWIVGLGIAYSRARSCSLSAWVLFIVRVGPARLAWVLLIVSLGIGDMWLESCVRLAWHGSCLLVACVQLTAMIGACFFSSWVMFTVGLDIVEFWR